MGAMSSSMELIRPSNADALSLSFCVSCLKKEISAFTPFISAVRFVREALHEAIAVKISLSEGSVSASGLVGA